MMMIRFFGGIPDAKPVGIAIFLLTFLLSNPLWEIPLNGLLALSS